MPNSIYQQSGERSAKRRGYENYLVRFGIIGESACCLLCRRRHKRHSFAVHRLISWYRQGADVQRLLPQLATYLGHVHISATQRYLTMTPELLREASKRFERYVWGQPHA